MQVKNPKKSPNHGGDQEVTSGFADISVVNLQLQPWTIEQVIN